MKRGALLTALAGLLAVVLYIRVLRPHYRNQHSFAAAPDLALVDLDGVTIHLTALKGKVVLVNFWAAWCTPCAEEVPQFIALQQKYQGRGLQIIGISIDDDEGQLRNFYRKYKMNYPVAPGDLAVENAFHGILGLPATFVIDRDQRIHAKHEGSTNFQALEAEVVGLLGQ